MSEILGSRLGIWAVMSPVAITLTREWRSRRAGREFEPCAPQWSIKYREQLDVLLLVLIGRADHIDGGAKPMVARGLIGLGKEHGCQRGPSEVRRIG